MKRILSAILALILLLSFCGCGKDKEDRGGSHSDASGNRDFPGVTAPKTDAQVLEEYKNILSLLDAYKANGNITYDYDGSTLEGGVALAHYYDDLQAMERVDGILQQSEEAAQLPDRQSVLSRFTFLEDVATVITTTSTDSAGKQTTQYSSPWFYSKEGTLIQADDLDVLDPRFALSDYPSTAYQITYDEDGKIAEKVYIDNGEVVATCTYEYYYEHTTGEKIRWNSDRVYSEVFYIYDRDDRLDRIKWNCDENERIGLCQFVRKFEYDDQERIITDEIIQYEGSYDTKHGSFSGGYDSTSEISYKYRMEYTYNEDGQRLSAVYSQERYTWDYGDERNSLLSRTQNQYTYTYDESGRPLTVTIVYGGEEPNPTELLVAYTYGNYAFYEVPAE